MELSVWQITFTDRDEMCKSVEDRLRQKKNDEVLTGGGKENIWWQENRIKRDK